jgi:hypothetical protein
LNQRKSSQNIQKSSFPPAGLDSANRLIWNILAGQQVSAFVCNGDDGIFPFIPFLVCKVWTLATPLALFPLHFDGLEAGSGLWTFAIPYAPRVVQKMLKYCCSPARQLFYASARGSLAIDHL